MVPLVDRLYTKFCRKVSSSTYSDSVIHVMLSKAFRNCNYAFEDHWDSGQRGISSACQSFFSVKYKTLVNVTTLCSRSRKVFRIKCCAHGTTLIFDDIPIDEGYLVGDFAAFSIKEDTKKKSIYFATTFDLISTCE